MRKIVGLLALIVVTGCSSSGGGTGAAGAGSTTPAGSSTSSASSATSPAQKPVPAEKNPPGDIPDNLAFVLYRNSSGRYSFTHPEGWAERTRSNSVTFTDKLNGVYVAPGSWTGVPTTSSARAQDVPALTSSQPAFQLRSVSAVSEPAGKGVRIVYRRNSVPDPVTGREYRDEVERYELFASGRSIAVELFGPVGADNVDAYRTMIKSLRLR
jgi:hypothetical protein